MGELDCKTIVRMALTVKNKTYILPLWVIWVSFSAEITYFFLFENKNVISKLYFPLNLLSHLNPFTLLWSFRSGWILLYFGTVQDGVYNFLRCKF